jgi:hypothetical protein
MMGLSARWGELAGSAKTPVCVLRGIASEKPEKPAISEEKRFLTPFSPLILDLALTRAFKLNLLRELKSLRGGKVV